MSRLHLAERRAGSLVDLPRLIARNGAAEAWLIGNDVYVRQTSGPMDTLGLPQGVRWESSLLHWELYFLLVRVPEGWEREKPKTLA